MSEDEVLDDLADAESSGTSLHEAGFHYATQGEFVEALRGSSARPPPPRRATSTAA